MMTITSSTLIGVLLAWACLLPASPSEASCPITCIDGNGDCETNASDALLTLRAAVGLRFCHPKICDATRDGNIFVSDALAVLLRAIGTLSSLPCETTPSSTTSSTTTSST